MLDATATREHTLYSCWCKLVHFTSRSPAETRNISDSLANLSPTTFPQNIDEGEMMSNGLIDEFVVNFTRLIQAILRGC